MGHAWPIYEAGTVSQVVIMMDSTVMHWAPVRGSGVGLVLLNYALLSSVLPRTVRPILSSRFNGGGKLSLKTLPAVTQQVRGKAKIWPRDSPTTLLSLVVKSQTGLTAYSTRGQAPPTLGAPPFYVWTWRWMWMPGGGGNLYARNIQGEGGWQ